MVGFNIELVFYKLNQDIVENEIEKGVIKIYKGVKSSTPCI